MFETLLSWIFWWFSLVAGIGGGAGGPFDSLAKPLAARIGLTHDAFTNVFCVTLALPLSALGRLLPLGNAMHAYHFLFGLIFSITVFGWETLHALLTSVVVFVILKWSPRRYSIRAVYIFAGVYLAMSHTFRMYTDYLGWSLDFTGPQMLITQKFMMLAVDFQDGANRSTKPRLSKLPHFLAFLGYVFYFPGYLGGPTFGVIDYLEFTEKPPARGNTLGASLLPAGKLLLQSLFFGITWVIVSTYYFPPSRLRDHAFYTDTTLLTRVLILSVTASVWRFKYMFGWRLAESAVVVSGCAYNDGKWDKMTTVFPVGVEFPENWQMIARSWNHYTHRYLKKCVYNRMVEPGKKPTAWATFVTFMASAIWHGFYPGYFIAFIAGAITEVAAKRVRRVVRPYVLGHSRLKLAYDILGTVTTILFFNYCVVPFEVLSLELSLLALSSVYWVGTVVPVLGLVVMAFIPQKEEGEEKVKGEKKKEEEERKEEEVPFEVPYTDTVGGRVQGRQRRRPAVYSP